MLLSSIIKTFGAAFLAQYQGAASALSSQGTGRHGGLPYPAKPKNVGSLRRMRSPNLCSALLRASSLPTLSIPRKPTVVGATTQETGAC